MAWEQGNKWNNNNKWKGKEPELSLISPSAGQKLLPLPEAQCLTTGISQVFGLSREQLSPKEELLIPCSWNSDRNHEHQLSSYLENHTSDLIPYTSPYLLYTAGTYLGDTAQAIFDSSTTHRAQELGMPLSRSTAQHQQAVTWRNGHEALCQTLPIRDFPH